MSSDGLSMASFVPTCKTICAGFFRSNGEMYEYISSILLPEKHLTFTGTFLFDKRDSSKCCNIESPTIRHVFFGHSCFYF